MSLPFFSPCTLQQPGKGTVSISLSMHCERRTSFALESSTYYLAQILFSLYKILFYTGI